MDAVSYLFTYSLRFFQEENNKIYGVKDLFIFLLMLLFQIQITLIINNN